MTVVVFVSAWLALSAIATLAYVFGARVGYRRGFEEARDQTVERTAAGPPAPAGIAVELRLPDGVRGAS